MILRTHILDAYDPNYLTTRWHAQGGLSQNLKI